MALVSLVYTAPVGVQPAASIATKLGAIPIYEGELAMLGLVVINDVALVASGEAARLIDLQTTPDGDALWPDATALAYATKNLYKQALAYKLPGKILAADPVVS